MGEFAEMGTMDIWYARLSEQELMTAVDNAARSLKPTEKKGRVRPPSGSPKRTAQKAPLRTRTACRPCRNSPSFVDGQYRIVSQPPIVVPARDLAVNLGVSP